jgi:hypothetical protein
MKNSQDDKNNIFKQNVEKTKHKYNSESVTLCRFYISHVVDCPPAHNLVTSVSEEKNLSNTLNNLTYLILLFIEYQNKRRIKSAT